MKDILFSNINLDRNRYYFFYIGELKSYGMNLFLKDFFAKKFKRDVGIVAVVPDVMKQYNYENIIVVNSPSKKILENDNKLVASRIKSDQFVRSVSDSKHIVEIIKKIVKNQGNLFVYMHESNPEMTLDSIDGVQLLGPKSTIANEINNKVLQYTLLNGIVPLADFRICSGLDELIDSTEKLRKKWKDGIFVSLSYSAAGMNSAITYSLDDILKEFKDEHKQYLITRYIPHQYDPTVLGVVANKSDIYIAGIADQRIEEGNKFTGSTYPSILNSKLKGKLKEHTRIVGRVLAEREYRGIFGCDFIVDENEDIHFIEVNARKQGTTMEFCCTMEQSLPKGSASIPEIEYYAVLKDILPENAMELDDNSDKVCWSTYNFKLKGDVTTKECLIPETDERKLFANVANREIGKGYMILEYPGGNLTIKKEGFLGRVVSVAKNREDASEGIELGKKTLWRYIDG